MTLIVYHTQSGTVSTTLCLPPSIAVRCFTRAEDLKGVTIVEAEACPDHIHMLLEIPPKISVSGFMGYLKGKSSQIIYEKWGNLRYKYRSREFWCRGYYVDTAGKNTKKIQDYIKNQLKEDQIAEQLELELNDPFKKKG